MRHDHWSVPWTIALSFHWSFFLECKIYGIRIKYFELSQNYGYWGDIHTSGKFPFRVQYFELVGVHIHKLVLGLTLSKFRSVSIYACVHTLVACSLSLFQFWWIHWVYYSAIKKQRMDLTVLMIHKSIISLQIISIWTCIRYPHVQFSGLFIVLLPHANVVLDLILKTPSHHMNPQTSLVQWSCSIFWTKGHEPPWL